MVTVLALLSALAYGAADFLGGTASRVRTAFTALVVSLPVGLALIFLGALATGGSPTVGALGWGLLSGLAGGLGFLAFYRALARGPMTVVAPVSALVAAVLPVVVGTARGERLDPVAIVGMVLCLVAIYLVSLEAGPSSDSGSRPHGLLDNGPVMALLSGLGFGIFFALLKESGSSAGLWPLVVARAGGILVLIAMLLALRVRPSGLRARTFLLPALLAGVLDASANIFYFEAVQRGTLSLTAVLTSLYPGVTVFLARMVHSERLRRIQQLGMAVAIAGVALVTVG